MKKGDIVAVPFPFVDLTGAKLRPALVLIVALQTVTGAFITSQLKWQEEYDLIVPAADDNRLKVTSLLKLNKIVTLDKELISGKLGSPNTQQTQLVDQNLIQLFQLA